MILQINKMYYSDVGGVETVVKNYSEYLKKYSEVVVLCVKKDFSLKTSIEEINGVKVYRCASFGKFLSMPVSLVFFIYLFFLSRRADYIHFHEPFPLGSVGGLLIPKSKKIFVTWHSDIIKQKSIKKFFEYFQKKLCKKADKIIATSDKLIEFSGVLRKFREKIITIPLSINPKSFLNVDCQNASFANLPKDYVLYLGRFSYYKGIFILLDAIEQIEENIPFVIVGDGDLASQIKDRVKKSKKNVLLIDRFVSDEEKKYYLSHSKFLVFPSIYPSEAFGIIQLEAMIYEKPVINTKLPTGVPWVSKHNETGLTVDVADSKGLANAVKRLYYDNELYKKLSHGAKKRVMENFVSEKTNEKLYQLYFGENKYD